ARATIEKYLSAMSPARTTLSGYLEATYGFDTNVNSATSVGSIAIPVFGGAVGTFSGSSLSLRDSYIGGAGSVTLSHRFTDYVAFVGTLGGTAKWNRHQDTFDTAGYDASAGLRFTPDEAHAITLAAQAQSFRLDNTRFRDSSGVLAQWQWTRTPNSQLSVFGQWAMLGYPSQPSRDAYRTVGGIAYAHGFGGTWNPVGFASVYGLHEKADDPENFSYYSNNGGGLRLGGQLNVLTKLQAFATASHERRRYSADDPFFLVRRADRQTDYRVGLNYAFADRWSLIPSVAVTKNRSNFELYTYSRTLSSVALRRDF
ncbi:MAG: surface lipoprotein assembly modifier, partial [Burkholderiales bacterium]